MEPEALVELAEARYRLGDYDQAIELRERAYAALRAAGDTRQAAKLAAYHLAFDYVAVHGNFATASGWLERGKRLAEESGDCAERGWVELSCALAAGSADEKDRHIANAREIARRHHDHDLEFDALAYAGVALVERGQVAEGMRRLDEAAAAARAEVGSETVAGEIYCKMLLACEMVLDVRRAEQWTGVPNAPDWASAICRMYYGGILTAAGRWAEADEQLTESVRLYAASCRALKAGAVVRLADLRVRQGRLEAAEELLTGHEHDSYAVRPLARLHLARGEQDLAAMLLRRHVGQHGDGMAQAPVLALLAEVEAEAGRFDDARAVCEKLVTPTESLRALADFCAGVVGAREGDPAVERFESALAGFGTAGLPYEEARTRLELARLTTGEVAKAEAKAALMAFERLGATREADAAAALLRSLGARGRTGPKDVGVLSQREQEVLALLGLGLSNPEIAARLFISRKTASHHVSNVLTKLGLRNRAEAAAYAVTGRR